MVLVALALVAGCGGGGDERSSGRAAEDSEPRSAWQQVLDQIGPNGEVSKEMALQAWSVALFPLPGVEVPDGPDEPIMSGSGPIRWVMMHYDDLTREQRRIVADFLDLDPIRFARRPSRAQTWPDDPGAGPFRALIDEIVPQIAGRLGRQLQRPIQVSHVYETSTELEVKDFFHLLPAKKAAPNIGVQTFNLDDRCVMVIWPHGAALVDAEGNSPELVAMMAHEVFHCFQGDLRAELAVDQPPWIWEGAAAYAGELHAGGSSWAVRWWAEYITKPGESLFSREYDAIGFYAAMAGNGVDFWTASDKIMRAYAAGADAGAFDAVIAMTGGDFLSVWPANWARDGTLGWEWEMRGPGITNAQYQPATYRPSAPATERVAAGANDYRLVDMDTEVVRIIMEASGWRLRFADGAQHTASSAASTRLFCTLPQSCACPTDSPGADLRFEPAAAGIARLAVSGGARGGSYRVDGSTLDEVCEEGDVPGRSAATLDPCLVGTWVTEGVVAPPEPPELVTDYGGGDGLILTIERDGSYSVDFDPMEPVTFRVSNEAVVVDTRMEFVGGGSGMLEAADGTIWRFRATSGGLVLRIISTIDGRVYEEPEIRSEADLSLIGGGSYACTRDSLETKVVSGAFESATLLWRRAG